MSFSAPRPVVSGKPYLVRQLAGHEPHELNDFVGDSRLVLDLDGDEYTVCGPGVQGDGCVRIYEKSDEGAGKDIRVWAVHPSGQQGIFTATAVGTDVPLRVRDGLPTA